MNSVVNQIACFLVGVGIATSLLSIEKTQETEVQKWEYRIGFISDDNELDWPSKASRFRKDSDLQGEEGWEMVSAYAYNPKGVLAPHTRHVAWFKRLKK